MRSLRTNSLLAMGRPDMNITTQQATNAQTLIGFICDAIANGAEREGPLLTQAVEDILNSQQPISQQQATRLLEAAEALCNALNSNDAYQLSEAAWCFMKQNELQDAIEEIKLAQ